MIFFKNQLNKKDENLRLKQFYKLLVLRWLSRQDLDRPKQSFGLTSKFSSLLSTHYHLPTKSGFTLVEVILYVAVITTIISVSSIFTITAVNSRIKNQTMSEVEQQGDLILQKILQTIRNADAINTPTQGNSSTSIDIDALGTLNDPTIFSLNNGTVFIQEGSGSQIALNNSYIQVSNLIFENTARPGTLDLIRVSFDVGYVNSNGKKEYEHTKSFYGSASIR